MRGRTLNHAFVILDEAQNTTREQMKMFLTRIGFGSKCVVTGDTSQVDLPKGTDQRPGRRRARAGRCEGIGFTHFTAADVVRHPLVARIVEAYEAHDQQRAAVGTPRGGRAAMKPAAPALQLSLQFADPATARCCRATACNAGCAPRWTRPAQIAVRIVGETRAVA
jgi:hypothetical protein